MTLSPPPLDEGRRGGDNKEDDSQPKKRRPAQDQNMDTTEKGGQTHPQQSGDNAHMALNRGPLADTAKEADQASSLVRPKTPKHGYDGSMRAGKTKIEDGGPRGSVGVMDAAPSQSGDNGQGQGQQGSIFSLHSASISWPNPPPHRGRETFSAAKWPLVRPSGL